MTSYPVTTATRPTGPGATLDAWTGFAPGPWADGVDVRDFIQRNYTPYTGDDSFLTGPTPRTTAIWQTLAGMFPQERAKGIYDVDAHTPSSIRRSGSSWAWKRATASTGCRCSSHWPTVPSSTTSYAGGSPRRSGPRRPRGTFPTPSSRCPAFRAR